MRNTTNPLKTLLLPIIAVSLLTVMALPGAAQASGTAYYLTAPAPHGPAQSPSLPYFQTDTPAAESDTTIPTQGPEDTLPTWLLVVPLLALVLIGLMVWRRPAMERTQTADPIAPTTPATGMTPITDRKPIEEESPQFTERD